LSASWFIFQNWFYIDNFTILQWDCHTRGGGGQIVPNNICFCTVVLLMSFQYWMEKNCKWEKK
jgi:hypothetical protein